MKRLSTFKRGFVSTFALDVVARGMSAVTTVLLLRALDVDGFAFVILQLSVAQFIGGAAMGGLRLRYVRLEAERASREAGEPTGFWILLRSGTVLILAAGVLGFLGASLIGIGDSAAERATFVGICTLFTLGHATVELSVAHRQAQLEFGRAGLLSASRSVVMLIIALFATFGVLETGEAVGTAFAIGVGVVAVVAAAPVAWRTRHSNVGREGRFGFGPESASLTVYSLASAGWSYATVFLIAALLDETAVASYGAAARYISVVVGPVPALVSVMRVRTAQRDIVDSTKKQIDMMRNWAKRVGPIAFAALAIAAIAAPFLIPIVDGGRYPLSVTLFEIKLVAAFAQLVTLPNPALLITQNRHGLLAGINGAALAASVILSLIAAPLLGAAGVVAVSGAVTVAQVVIVTWCVAHPPEGTTPRSPESAVPVGASQSAPESV
jgi:O-antigen/teichoic acid export membrane protein